VERSSPRVMIGGQVMMMRSFSTGNVDNDDDGNDDDDYY